VFLVLKCISYHNLFNQDLCDRLYKLFIQVIKNAGIGSFACMSFCGDGFEMGQIDWSELWA
jgi:hypothetical protein